MNNESKEHSGLVLAGGQSRRMSRDKALLPYRGTTLLNHAVELLAPLCTEVVISSNTPQHHIPDARLLPDEFPQQGPLGGLIAGLKNTSSSYMLTLPCDTPLVPIKALQQLIDIDTEEPSVIVFREKSQIHPLIGSYPKSLLPQLEGAFASSERSIVRLLSKIPVVFIEANANLPWYKPGVFENINTLADYQNLLES